MVEKKSLRYLAEKVKDKNEKTDHPVIVIAHGDCLEDANRMKEMVLSEFSDAEIVISEVSATIATHVGPNMIAIGFMGEERI